MAEHQPIELSRDCDVTMIPSGQRLKLPKGSVVSVTQSLGGSFTVMTDQGYMVQISGKDADALGKDVPEAPRARPGQEGKSLEDLIWEQLKTCFDPEIPVNIVDLGLIYECKISDHPAGGKKVGVKMTLTAPGCGMGDPIRFDAMNKIQVLPGVKEADVELVWEPAWNQSMMSEAAKLQLGL